MPKARNRWWHLSAVELAVIAGILSSLLAILIPAVVVARSHQRGPASKITTVERCLLRFVEEYWHGWVYLLGAVACGALAAVSAYASARFIQRRLT